MKKTRFLAFLCVLALALSVVSFASAVSPTRLSVGSLVSNHLGYESDFYLLKNGENAKFFAHADYMGSLISPADGAWYTDLAFDTENIVKAKSSAKWVHITDSKDGFFLTTDRNTTQKNRTATITFTAKGYKATVKLTQFGATKLISAERNKKTVTLKFKFPSSAKAGRISIYYYDEKEDAEGFSVGHSKSVNLAKGVTTYKFKVKAGYYYSVDVGAEYKINGDRTTSNSTGYFYFNTFGDLSGKEAFNVY